MKPSFGEYRRRSIRLRGYDYSRAGFYFVTICIKDRECLFGEINNGRVILNEAGKMVEKIWRQIPEFYSGVNIDEFIIMPNHIHGIVEIIENINPVGADPRVGPCSDRVGPCSDRVGPCSDRVGPCSDRVGPCSDRVGPKISGQTQGSARTDEFGQAEKIKLSQIIQRFKSLTTLRYIDGVNKHGWLQFPGRIWHRNYYERIIRSQRELNNARKYIKNNPFNWNSDLENPIR